MAKQPKAKKTKRDPSSSNKKNSRQKASGSKRPISPALSTNPAEISKFCQSQNPMLVNSAEHLFETINTHDTSSGSSNDSAYTTNHPDSFEQFQPPTEALNLVTVKQSKSSVGVNDPNSGDVNTTGGPMGQGSQPILPAPIQRPIRNTLWKGHGGPGPVGVYPPQGMNYHTMRPIHPHQTISPPSTSPQSTNSIYSGPHLSHSAHQQYAGYQGGFFILQPSSSGSLSGSSTSLDRSQSSSSIPMSISRSDMNHLSSSGQLLQALATMPPPKTLLEAADHYIDYLVRENDDIANITTTMPIHPMLNISYDQDAFYTDVLNAEPQIPTPKFKAFLDHINFALPMMKKSQSTTLMENSGMQRNQNITTGLFQNGGHSLVNIGPSSSHTPDLGTVIRNACSLTGL